MNKLFSIAVATLMLAATAAMAAPQTQQVANALAPIKSKTQFDQYIKLTPRNVSPLAVLNATNQQKFVSSVTFNESGVTGFNYDVLAKNSSSKQAAAILKLIGMQHLASAGQVKLSGPGGTVAPMDYYDDDWENWDPIFGPKDGQNCWFWCEPDKPYPGTPNEPPKSSDTDYLNYVCQSRATCMPQQGWVCTKYC